ncbi:MAG: hypothetical protein RIR12_156 [Bacteroidota bacterium]
MYTSPTLATVDSIMQRAWTAFTLFKKTSCKQRADFMRAIAIELEACGDTLIQITMQETNLPEARLRGERGRTILQLNEYADACEKGNWLEVRIDNAIIDKTPPKPDIRKMNVAIGPVVVFGASNFPYAYSTAGGDTASAFAAGCPVIVKGHPAHPKTSAMVANAILKAAVASQMPDGVFAHIQTSSFEIGKALVTHQFTKAVGFTGSYTGGKQLFDWANQRKEPIPVFAEMGSINPVFLLPDKLKVEAETMAAQFASSITLGVGQFCTNPGLIIGIESEALQLFITSLGKAVEQVPSANMLHQGIADAYIKNKAEALQQAGVEKVSESSTLPTAVQGQPVIATVSAQAFLTNLVLHKEVFGPYSIIVRCDNEKEMLQVAQHLEGQLTATLMATEVEMQANTALIDAIENRCGRFVVNGVPTGVEVCLSMQHGGPFPSSTDARFTSVGADAIKRFVRPVCFQNWPDALLPNALKQGNPLGIARTVNNE